MDLEIMGQKGGKKKKKMFHIYLLYAIKCYPNVCIFPARMFNSMLSYSATLILLSW